MATINPFDKVLGALSSGRSGQKTASFELYKLPLGHTDICAQCGSPIELREMLDYKARPFRYWSDCPCIGKAADRAAELAQQSRALQADQRVEIISDPVPLGAFTLETFDPTRLHNGQRVVDVACGWLEAISPHWVAPSYHAKPRACLYFYSQGKGRGKTHLAGALINAARADGRRAVLVNETDYIERYWAASLEDRATLSALPGDRAWLTAIDDLGQRESTGAGLRDAWYDVLNARWLKRGWLIVTSNYKPDELVERGTISEATYSRLVQMTQGKLITFEGVDQRLQYQEAA